MKSRRTKLRANFGEALLAMDRLFLPDSSSNLSWE
jgi:hypothetical protein